jgi:hypothetical protein
MRLMTEALRDYVGQNSSEPPDQDETEHSWNDGRAKIRNQPQAGGAAGQARPGPARPGPGSAAEAELVGEYNLYNG